ncbi:hypothetical protein N7449_003826 [Penicillium cf. viridicatum]|uniref:Uncharacterized protein n=1 Tax=Penicillium cf. viridicatum TaxID=2972119 RepID=A0A9W9T4R5_9EURO|nr:hypothetical protein N7449_003826 [Penicillium cf. viridicatum]
MVIQVGPFGNRFRWCLVIDKEALQSLIRHQKPLAVPLQVEEDSTEGSEAWVTVVEPEYEQEKLVNTQAICAFFFPDSSGLRVWET